MSYLSVTNFWKYQNADVWKKAKGHPPWFKHYVNRDRELDALPITARLLYWELLGAATRYSNVLEADLNWIWAETRIDPEAIAEALPILLKGGWLSQTQTPRRSRKQSRNNRDDSLDLKEEEVEVREEGFTQTPKSRARDAAKAARKIRTMIRNGVITDHIDLDAELTAAGLNGDTATHLRSLLPDPSANGQLEHDRIPFAAILDTAPDTPDEPPITDLWSDTP